MSVLASLQELLQNPLFLEFITLMFAKKFVQKHPGFIKRFFE